MAQNPHSRGWTGRFVAIFFLSLSILAAKEMRLGEAASAVSKAMEAVVNSLTFPDNEHRLREKYTGIVPLDFGLRFLVAAFLPGVAGWEKGVQFQQIYFLVSFFPIIAISSVEAGRKRSFGAWTSFTSLWALLYQIVGGAIIIPFYYLAYMIESAKPAYWSPPSTHVPVAYAKALLPSLLIGYLLPTILMYLPFRDPNLSITQALIALWQFTPLIVNLLLTVISKAYGKEPAPSMKALSDLDDVRYLDRLYITCFVVSALAHISIILGCLSSSPQISFTHAFVRVPIEDRFSMTGGLHYIFQVDYWIIFVAALAGAFLSLWDLKRIGRTDLSLPKIAAVMAVATICVGPAATIAGVWYVKEHIMIKKDRR